MRPFFTTISNTFRPWYVPLVAGLLTIAMSIYIVTVPLETFLALTVLFMVSFIVLAPSEILGTNNIVCLCNINLKNPYMA